jgi:8-amino-7-oxononanoate synthase
MSNSINQYILQKVQDRKAVNNFRELKIQKGLIDFFSNDYLGFARNNKLQEAALAEVRNLKSEVRNGSTGSRLLSGNNTYAVELENRLAEFHDAECALIFNSGYDANLGVLSSIPYKNAIIFYDELVHASMHDGMRLSKAAKVSFKHNDVEDLEAKLNQASGLKFIALEALYSMDGDEADLKAIVTLAKKYDAAIILDEAHSNGIIGQIGEGKAQAEQLHHDIFIRIHTFGKAIGAHGAVVLCNNHTKDFLINYCRPFIFSTALSLHALASIKVAYDYLPYAISERTSLAKNVLLFKELIIAAEGFDLLPSSSPIQCLVKQGNGMVKQMAQKIQEMGFDVRAILAPTVPEGKERIRVCLHSFNSSEEIEALAQSVQKLNTTNSHT